MADCEILVIGGGPAGMAAVLGAWEAGCRKILLVERSEQLGGILRQCLHSGFGLATFGEELTGPEYARRYIQRLQGLPVDILTDTSVIELKPDGTALLSGAVSGLTNIKAAAVILASGCRSAQSARFPLQVRGRRYLHRGAAQKMVNLGGYDFGAVCYPGFRRYGHDYGAAAGPSG